MFIMIDIFFHLADDGREHPCRARRARGTTKAWGVSYYLNDEQTLPAMTAPNASGRAMQIALDAVRSHGGYVIAKPVPREGLWPR